MGHQTIDTQEKALEVAMKPEATPRDETQPGVQKIQGDLEAIHVEIQSLRKEHEIGSSLLQSLDTRNLREPLLWCNDCRVEGSHDAHHCPRLTAFFPKVKQ